MSVFVSVVVSALYVYCRRQFASWLEVREINIHKYGMLWIKLVDVHTPYNYPLFFCLFDVLTHGGCGTDGCRCGGSSIVDLYCCGGGFPCVLCSRVGDVA